MNLKHSNLICSIDLTNSIKIVALLDNIGDDICAVKLHINIIENFNQEFINKLIELKTKHNFFNNRR